MRVLVTGVARRIGRLVAERLLNVPDVDEVIGLDARACVPPVPGMHFVRADVRQPEWIPWLRGVEAVVHLDGVGWPLPRALRAQEAALPLRARALVEAVGAAGVPRLVIANSVALYGPASPGALLSEDSPVRGHSASGYARARAQLADMIDALERRWPGLAVTRLRTGWIVGRRHPALAEVWHSGPVVACGFENRVLPVVHEDDFCDAVRVALRGDLPGVLHVAAGDGLSLRELAALLGHDDVCRPLPWLLLHAWVRWRWLGARTPPDWLRDLYHGGRLDCERLRAVGWSPRWTPREAVAAALDALRAE